MGNNKLLTVWLIFAISCSGHGHSAEEEEGTHYYYAKFRTI